MEALNGLQGQVETEIGYLPYEVEQALLEQGAEQALCVKNHFAKAHNM